MKTIFFMLTLCVLFSFNFDQRIRPGYFIGKWEIADSSHLLPGISFQFKDSTHVKLTIANEGTANLVYSVNATHDPVLLHFRGLTADNKKMDTYWFIKIVNDSTLQAEEPLYSRQDNWDDDLAITFLRKKK